MEHAAHLLSIDEPLRILATHHLKEVLLVLNDDIERCLSTCLHVVYIVRDPEHPGKHLHHVVVFSLEWAQTSDRIFRLQILRIGRCHSNSFEPVVRQGVGYAESDDGLTWPKPSLGLIEFQGSKDNNIVAPLLERQSQQGATVVRDAAAPPEERYRLWTKFQPTDDELARGARPGLYAMHSPDGLRWTPYPNQPTPPDQQCDTQNMLFWDHRIDQWVGYTRVRETQHADEAAAAGHHIYRSIGRITSPDLERWTSTDIVLEPDRADLSIPRPVPPAEPEGPLPRPTLDFYTRTQRPIPGRRTCT